MKSPAVAQAAPHGQSRAEAAAPTTPRLLDGQQVLLSTLPPSRGQTRLALAIGLVLLAAFCATVPFATVPLRYTREFIPAYATAMFVISLITAALLYVQFSIVRSRALLAISGGYLFSTLMTIPWALTFPDLFEQTEIASTTWGLLSTLWHLGFALFVIAYALLKDNEPSTRLLRRSLPFAVLSSAAGVVIVDALVWLVTPTNASMPTTLALFERSYSYWNGLLGRVYFLISSALVLMILLSETAFLYARLARSVMAESREREARLMTMDVLSASIAHEMNQPLASIVTNADAAARWMGRPAPDLDEVKSSLEQIRNSAYRARDLIVSIRAMVKRDGRNRSSLDLNELVREVLVLTGRELQRSRVSVELGLAQHLPPVKADRTQLQQVLINLITNAIEAMRENKQPRILRVKSALQGPNRVLISVADSGPGIDAGIVDRIFNPLFTTKSNGMGMVHSSCPACAGHPRFLVLLRRRGWPGQARP